MYANVMFVLMNGFLELMISPSDVLHVNLHIGIENNVQD